MPDLVARLSGLHATLTQRLTLQESLLSLSGRLDMVISQIEMRSSGPPAPLPMPKNKKSRSKPNQVLVLPSLSLHQCPDGVRQRLIRARLCLPPARWVLRRAGRLVCSRQHLVARLSVGLLPSVFLWHNRTR